MARKDLLKSLMETPKDAEAPTPRVAGYQKGAIGAVGRSIADLKSRAIVDIVADQIDNAGLKDRLEEDPEALDRLKASLAEYGQQVPVMLRFSPNTEGRYEVIYGRRRVAALKALKMPVKAMIRDMTDRELVVAQGQENNARRDLSFIEKANFARQMAAQGFERKVICDALDVDKTVVSRMLAIADTVTEPLIRRIGAAPGVGRDRWTAFARAVETASKRRLDGLVIEGATSDARFDAALKALTAKEPRATPEAETIRAGRTTLATVRRGAGGATLALTHTKDGFDQWLIDRLPDLHRDFLEARGEADPD